MLWIALFIALLLFPAIGVVLWFARRNPAGAAAPDAAFFTCDVRGIGESQPNTCGVDQFLKPYGSHYFYAAHGLMLDRPLLGQRTFDVIRVLQVLAAAGHEQIHVAGLGWGALPALLAALLSDRVTQVTLKHSLKSFSELAENEDCQAIVRSVIGLANELGMTTTAEGVEATGQLAALRAQGCDQAQGFLFSKAVPVSELRFVKPKPVAKRA